MIDLWSVSPRGILETQQALRQRSEDGTIPQYYEMLISLKGPVAQWMRHRSAELGIAGSSPAGAIFARPLETGEIEAADMTCTNISRHD